ncbi:Sporulation related domain-containing protein [Ectothiorhodospira magna]|uniref:Sporulation related domain-containing protein n=1 Tax=Ectothiorhodospira magna TaxID=867345 RepID=A0A1H9CHT5_9GAMM|nr:SPOR domain-containing protein [Ectothiorhodospira magna]SEQ00800.1 Sporulation related domain-containing protein [Ectothiorhodospira magna]
MRLLCLVLLLLNLALLWYGLAASPSEPSPASASPPVQRTDVPLLRLIHETPSPTVFNSSPLPEPAPQCIRLGPFQDSQSVKPLQAILDQEHVTYHLQAMTQSRPQSYWVILPTDNRAEARAAVAQLTARGVDDHYIITQGPHTHGVSLGLFSEQARAIRRMEQVRQVDLEPIIETRYREVTLYWLEVTLTVAGLQALMPSLPPEISVMEQACAPAS